MMTDKLTKWALAIPVATVVLAVAVRAALLLDSRKGIAAGTPPACLPRFTAVKTNFTGWH